MEESLIQSETENGRFIRLSRYSETLPPIDISDPEQVRKRILQYFDFCIKNNRIPQIIAIANWLGVSRDTINSWKRGQFRSSTHQAIIEKAYGIVEEITLSRLMDDKMASSLGICMLKNYFNYSDKFNFSLQQGTPQEPAFTKNDSAKARERIENFLKEERKEDPEKKEFFDLLMEQQEQG